MYGPFDVGSRLSLNPVVILIQQDGEARQLREAVYGQPRLDLTLLLRVVSNPAA
jgi:hypothetical protein